MALINIEYGALASSEVMNKNFIYLDDKISENSESLMTSISSILSNIATINTRLNEISENTSDSITNLSSIIEEYKSKTKLLVKKASMLPDWNNCMSISVSSNFTAPMNGYVLLVPDTITSGNLKVNGKTVVFKVKNSTSDYSAQLTVVPVSDGDVVSCTAVITNAYFLPFKDIVLEDF